MKTRICQFLAISTLSCLTLANASAQGWPFGNIGLGLGTNPPLAQLDLGGSAYFRGPVFVPGNAEWWDGGIPPPPNAWPSNATNNCIYFWNPAYGAWEEAIGFHMDNEHIHFGGLPIQNGVIRESSGPGILYLNSDYKGIVWTDGERDDTEFARIEPVLGDPPAFRFRCDSNEGMVSWLLTPTGIVVEAAQ